MLDWLTSLRTSKALPFLLIGSKHQMFCDGGASSSGLDPTFTESRDSPESFMVDRGPAFHSLVQATSGGAAACLTTLFLYPFDVVKTRLNRGQDEKGVKYNGLGDVVTRQARKGFKGFYSGMQVANPRVESGLGLEAPFL